MIRGLLKLIILLAVLVGAGVFFLGWNLSDVLEGNFTGRRAPVVEPGSTAAEKGREAGAAVGERAGQAAEATRRAVADGALTAKIKAKMSLDDSVKALNLNVDTAGGVVTVKGIVRSEAERQRALLLARETDGVTQVIDQLQVR